MRRYLWFVTMAVGVLLVASAGIVRWVVAPALTVLPSDTDTVRMYSGVATTLFNPTAVPGPMMGPAILRDLPVSVVHHVTVVDTNGDSALVTDHKLLTIPGRTIADLKYLYAVDRTSLQSAGGFAHAAPHQGLTFNWPLNTQRHDYTGWVSDSGTTTRLHYTGETTRGGVTTYMFTAQVTNAPINDRQILALLPPSLPKATLMSMVPTLGLTTEQLTQMSKVLPQLPDPVPFAYTYSITATYWVAPQSGIVVDATQHETRSAAMVSGPIVVPVGSVMDMTYSDTPATLRAAANDARDAVDAITLITDTVPLVTLITGFVLLAVGAGMQLRRRPPAPPSTPIVEPRELTPVG